MKRSFLFSILFLVSFVTFSQNEVFYVEDNSEFANPERGFYHHTETHSNSYSSLNANTLSGYRVNENITLILRVFYLEDFKSSDISETYLNNIRQDLTAVRSAGIKCIMRFAYNNNQTQTDASKAQMLAHLDQLKPVFEEYSDVIALMQAGFIGSWGEWYYTTQTEFGLPGSIPNYSNRGDVLSKILEVLPTSRMVQVRTPTFKREIYDVNTALTLDQAYNESDISRTGHHNDCFLASSTDFGTYGNVTTDKNYLSQECLYLVNGGETCASSSFSGCINAVEDLSNLRFTYLNTDYNRAVLDTWESDGCMEEVVQKLGYSLTLLQGEFPEVASAGDSISIHLELMNNGWAAPFNPRDVEIVLRSTSNPSEITILPLTNDPRLWLPQEEVIIDTKLELPRDLTTGEYELLLNLPDASSLLKNRAEYSIRMSNENTWEASTGYNNLNATVMVSEVTALGGEFDSQTIEVSPNPVKNSLFISVSSIETNIYSVTGERILAFHSGEKQFDVSSLPSGVYFLEVNLEGGRKEKVRIVKH